VFPAVTTSLAAPFRQAELRRVEEAGGRRAPTDDARPPRPVESGRRTRLERPLTLVGPSRGKVIAGTAAPMMLAVATSAWFPVSLMSVPAVVARRRRAAAARVVTPTTAGAPLVVTSVGRVVVAAFCCATR